jgi:hypothetical protein
MDYVIAYMFNLLFYFYVMLYQIIIEVFVIQCIAKCVKICKIVHGRCIKENYRRKKCSKLQFVTMRNITDIILRI